jgi:hypothetical protein
MVMLVKVNSIDTVIPLKELELNIPGYDESVIQILKNSSYSAVFTEGNIEENNAMTMDELYKEKSKTIDKAASARQI